MRYVHMRYSSCCSCYCCRCCRCCRCSRRRRRRRAGCRRCHCCCSCRCCCCRAAAAAAAAAAAVAISCLCYAACHAACHAVCPGAWRTRFVWFMRRMHASARAREGQNVVGGFIGFEGTRTHMHSKIPDEKIYAVEQLLALMGPPGSWRWWSRGRLRAYDHASCPWCPQQRSSTQSPAQVEARLTIALLWRLCALLMLITMTMLATCARV